MQEGQTVLAIISERGRKGLPLERVYRHLFNRDLYLCWPTAKSTATQEL
jgi:hypothetical protein